MKHTWRQHGWVSNQTFSFCLLLFLKGEGEIYLSKIGRNKIKAWKMHKRANLNLFIIRGKVKFVIIDNNNEFKEFLLNSNNNRLFVKRNTIFGFQNLYKEESIILSLSNIKYDKTESLNYPLKDIKYKW